MAVREVIEIDEELCDGCGDCISACAEGALALVDGKARLVSDVYCDGLGACLGDCPRGAISIIRREAEAFDEAAVEQHLAKLDPTATAATSGAAATPATAATSGALPIAGHQAVGASCPGSQTREWAPAGIAGDAPVSEESALRQWPIQLHLVPPTAPFFTDADVLLAADCVAFSVGGFHRRFLDGRALAIACPKLDSQQEIYLEKLTAMIDEARIRALEVMVMEVPCCTGLVRLAQEARARATRDVPIRCTVVGVQGNVLGEQTL
jgi:NAD-dependent dihydropyrimidine dehydrogenase PreA subunit